MPRNGWLFVIDIVYFSIDVDVEILLLILFTLMIVLLVKVRKIFLS